jgi:hypothetical protein
VVALFIWPRGEPSRRPAGYGGSAFNGGWPLWGGEREAVGAGFHEAEATRR